jgi:hypothetical protein
MYATSDVYYVKQLVQGCCWKPLMLLALPLLQAFRVLLQQRVSAVAVLAGAGSSVNMRLVGNLSASDLRHLRRGGFGVLALSVKQFLASKPLAPDQVEFWGLAQGLLLCLWSVIERLPSESA